MLTRQVEEDRRAARIDFVENRNAIGNLIMKFNIHDGSELMALPAGAALVNKLPGYWTETKLDSYINNLRKSANVINRGRVLEELNGLKNNDTEAFLNITDFSKYKDLGLTSEDIIKLENEQAKIARRPEMGNDMRVNRAMGTLKANYAIQMSELRLMSRTSDPTQQKNYDSMTGMLQTAINVWPEEHNGKAATDKDIRETIGPEVLQHYSESRWAGLWHEDHPVFKGWKTPMPEDIPEDFRAGLIRDQTEKGRPMPTPHQINQAYLKMLYDQTVKEYKKGADAAKPK
jgi:hypothetical protein